MAIYIFKATPTFFKRITRPSSLNLSTNKSITNEELRKKLFELGDNPGPVTSTTRQVYLKRFINLQKRTQPVKPYNKFISFKTYTDTDDYNDEIKSTLIYGDWVNQLGRYKIIEKTVFEEFSIIDTTRKWRDGTNKTSFNYLLLDPRVTKDLPSRAGYLTKSEIWTTFLSAIFYVGKGSRNRPYSHLKDAFDVWISHKKECKNAKVQKIINIWNEEYGIVCLHIFQNVIPVEAYTREAAIIDALGKEKLKNCIGGKYYGKVATWNINQKCDFGRYLLYQALQIFLHEGERQIYPYNL